MSLGSYFLFSSILYMFRLADVDMSDDSMTGLELTSTSIKKRPSSDDLRGETPVKAVKKLNNTFSARFKAPVFQLEKAIKNMSYTVDKFCKKMGGLDKCSDRLFYGLWMLLDIHEYGSETNVNIEKKSLLSREEYSQQSIELIEKIEIKKSGRSHTDDDVSMGEDQPSQFVPSSTGRNKKPSVEGQDTEKAASTLKDQAKENIKRFMKCYIWKNGLGESYPELYSEDNKVKEFLGNIGDGGEGCTDEKLHELYITVFKTHGHFFGGMRDVINEVLNTKQAKSQAEMAGVSFLKPTPQHESYESFVYLGDISESDDFESFLHLYNSGESQGKFIKFYKTEVEKLIEQDFGGDDERRIKLLDELGKLINEMNAFDGKKLETPGYQNYNAKEKKDFAKPMKKLMDEFQDRFVKVAGSGSDEGDTEELPEERKKNRFFRNKGFEDVRKNFYNDMNIQLRLGVGDIIKIDGVEGEITGVDGNKYTIVYGNKQRKTIDYQNINIGEQEAGMQDILKFLNCINNNPCMAVHPNKKSYCHCCKRIEKAIVLEYVDGDKITEMDLDQLIKHIFDEEVFIDDKKPIIEGSKSIKIDINTWKSTEIMGDLLEGMPIGKRTHERKLRSWITSCLMPVTEDGSLFKNEYEHVFPVLFLFLFVGGYIHLPSSTEAQKHGAKELQKKFCREINDKLNEADNKYTDICSELTGDLQDGKITKEGQKKQMDIAWKNHCEKKDKINKTLSLLGAFDLFPFNGYNLELFEFMFKNAKDHILEYIIDTVYLFHESVLLCESDPNQFKSNAIYAKVNRSPASDPLWSSSNQSITRFLKPIEEKIQAIDYSKSLDMIRSSKVPALYAGIDTQQHSYASVNMSENTGALSESLINASFPTLIESQGEVNIVKETGDYGEYVFTINKLPDIKTTSTKDVNGNNMTLRNFYDEFKHEIISLKKEKKLALHPGHPDKGDISMEEEEFDKSVYFFSKEGNRVILKVGDTFDLVDKEVVSKHVITKLEYDPDPPRTPGQGIQTEDRPVGQGRLDIFFKISKLNLDNRFSSPRSALGGMGGKKKRSKKKRTKKKRRKRKKRTRRR